MSMLKELMEKVGPDFKLDTGALDGYKDEKKYIERAKEKLKIPKHCYPDLIDKQYEDGFEHGFIEASVDAFEEKKKLNSEISNLKAQMFFGNCENCKPLLCCSGRDCGCMGMPIDFEHTDKCDNSCSLRAFAEREKYKEELDKLKEK